MEEYKKVTENIKKKINNLSPITNNYFISELEILQENILNFLHIEISLIKIKNEKIIFDNLEKISLLALKYLTTFTEKESIQIIKENQDLFEKKNNDYGCSYKDFTLLGLIVRINDKINRILTIEKKNTMVDEDKCETVNDLYNYCIISLTYRN